jgi:flagellin
MEDRPKDWLIKEDERMALRIQNNVEAFNAHRNLSATESKLGTSMERLSSGYRINRAADDAAGLAISERLRGQIQGLGQSQRNVQDAVSLVQTAEGSLTEVHAMLQRVRELAVQYKNGSLSTADRTAIQSEVNQLASEIERIGSSAEFNGIKLLNTAQTISFQVGAKDGDTIAVTTVSLGSASGVGSNYIALSTSGASDISEIDAAIDNVSAQRATFGAVQNRLEYTLQNAAIYQENLTASESRVRDVDMAAEMVNFTKLQILQNAGTAMLAQANQGSQGVLSLLR